MSTTNSEPQNSRRSFLGILGAIFLGFIGLVMGVVSGIYATFPAFFGKSKKDLSWQTIGKLEQIPEGFTQFTVNITEQNGWQESSSCQAVWIARKGQQIDVYSAVCPHEGCTVTRQGDCFACLCHMSKWQDDGAKISGPTPRSLDTLDHRVNNNNLEIKYESFTHGLEQKVPLT